MTFPSGLDISRGLGQGVTKNHKFGRNKVVGGTFAPIAIGGIYRTPQASAATALRIKAGGNANDTANGSGARAISVTGLNALGIEISETIVTNGASASLPTEQQFIRLYRAIVTASGTYASAVAGSHANSIVIERAAGGEDWATITDTDFARAQSQVAVYTVPLQRTAFISSIKISSDADKKVNLILFQRQKILQLAAPYEAMRVVEEYPQIAGVHDIHFDQPLGPFPELTDIGFMGKAASSTADITVSYEIIEVRP
jgi:hypothetical protein